MTEIDVFYEGNLHCRAKHGPSGSEIFTDAPKDNEGTGETFSPSDLVGASMGACVLTIMGIYARKKGIDLKGSRVHVEKEMVSKPHRKIGRIDLTIYLPAHVDEAHRAPLRRAAELCPVERSLHPDMEVNLAFRFEI